LGFRSDRLEVRTLTPAGDTLYREFKKSPGARQARLRYCANAAQGVCNWLVPADSQSQFCVACELNRTIPNLAEASNLTAWGDFERAKKRLVYSLLRFGLPLDGSAV